MNLRAIFSTKQHEYLFGLSLRKIPFPREVLDDNLKLLRDDRQSPGGGGLPCMGYIVTWGFKGYGFSAILVKNRLSNLVILAINSLWSCAPALNGYVFYKKLLFHHYRQDYQQKPFINPRARAHLYSFQVGTHNHPRRNCFVCSDMAALDNGKGYHHSEYSFSRETTQCLQLNKISFILRENK